MLTEKSSRESRNIQTWLVPLAFVNFHLCCLPEPTVADALQMVARISISGALFLLLWRLFLTKNTFEISGRVLTLGVKIAVVYFALWGGGVVALSVLFPSTLAIVLFNCVPMLLLHICAWLLFYNRYRNNIQSGSSV